MIKSHAEKTDTVESRRRIFQSLRRKPRTANEVIDNLFENDVRTGVIENRSWKYYVHLNKLFTVLEKKGYIFQDGTKTGLTKRQEKIWRVHGLLK